MSFSGNSSEDTQIPHFFSGASDVSHESDSFEKQKKKKPPPEPEPPIEIPEIPKVPEIPENVLHVNKDASAGVHPGTQVPYEAINFILHQLVPGNQIAGKRIPATQQRLRQLVDQEFASVVNTFVELHGCIMEGFDSPNYGKRPKESDFNKLIQEHKNIHTGAEVDFMLVATDMNVGYPRDPDVEYYIYDKMDDQAGYVALRILDYNHPQHDFFKKEIKGIYYLQSEEVGKDFDKGLNDGFIAADVPEDKKQKLAFTTMALGFPCERWPKDAEPWLKRSSKTGWPSMELKEEVEKTGCHLVPKSREEAENASILWQFVFPKAENLLGKNLTLTHYQVFDLLMMIREHYGEDAKILSNYMINTVLFWMSEERPMDEWTSERLVQMLLETIEKLLGYLDDENLPHYFIPEKNLLDEINPDVLEKLSEVLKEAEKDPLGILMKFAETRLFQFHPATVNFTEIMTPITAESLDESVGLREDKRMRCLGTMAKHFYMEDRNVEGNVMVEQMKQSDESEEPLAALLPFLNDIDQAVEMHEHMLEKWPNSRNSSLYKGNLAFIIFSRSFSSGEDGSFKSDMSTTSKDMFEDAMKMPGLRTVTKVDYLNYLFKTNKVEEQKVMALLEKVIGDEKANLTPEKITTKRYLPIMKKAMPEELTEVLERNAGPVVLACLANAYYLMVIQFVKSNKLEEAKKVVKHFEEDVNKMSNEDSNIPDHLKFDICQSPEKYLPTAHALLALAAKKAEDFRTSANCCTKLLEKTPGDAALMEELETCISQLKSVGENTTELEGKLTKFQKDKPSLPRMNPEDEASVQRIMEQLQGMDIPQQPRPPRSSTNNIKLAIEKAKEGLLYLKNGNIDAANKIKVELLELLPGQDPESVLSSLALQVEPLDDSIALYEYVIAAYPDSEQLYSHQGNLACMLHSKSTTFADGTHQRKEYQTRSRETFELAISYPNACASTRMDFSVLLHQLKDYDTLVPMLNKVLAEEKPKVETGRIKGNSYGMNEKNTVDENIKREIEARQDDLSIGSIFHAFYIQIKILKADNSADDVAKVLNDFQLYAKKLPKQSSYQEMAWVLLGYAAQEAEQYKLAEQAFGKVLQVAPKNPLAEDNLQLNQGLGMSMETEQLVEGMDLDDDFERDEEEEEVQNEEVPRKSPGVQQEPPMADFDLD